MNTMTYKGYSARIDYDDEDGSVRVPLVGRYVDVLMPHDGRWKFAHRVINGDLSRPRS